MAGLRSFRAAFLPLALGATVGIAGCRGTTPQPVTRKAPEAAPKEQPAPAAADAANAAPSQAPAPVEIAAAREKTGDAAPVVVDAGVEDAAAAPATLVEAARAERQRRAGAGKKSIAVINDKTLPKYASKGQITIADTKKDKNKVGAASPQVAAAEAEARDEQHWRSRARQLRENWRLVADEVKELERKSAELRQKFYGETDTFLRDTQVKPDWDRVLDRLRQARLDVDTARQDLATFLEEGRAAGAQPGWLDEGSEEEPADESGKQREPVPALQSIEPPVIENDSIKSPPPGF